jgi:hypothetical protein
MMKAITSIPLLFLVLRNSYISDVYGFQPLPLSGRTRSALSLLSLPATRGSDDHQHDIMQTTTTSDCISNSNSVNRRQILSNILSTPVLAAAVTASTAAGILSPRLAFAEEDPASEEPVQVLATGEVKKVRSGS